MSISTQASRASAAVDLATTTVQMARIDRAGQRHHADLLAVEEPLEIRLGHVGRRDQRVISVTMRTPGHDTELAAGFLFTEGILADPQQILTIRPCRSNRVVRVALRPEVEVDLKRLDRHFYTASSCGVCGKTSLEAVRVQVAQRSPSGRPQLDGAMIHRLPERLRAAQAVFDRTGGLHAAALFDPSGTLLALREDVGRHNAVDKLIGAEFLAGRVPLVDRLLLVSGRASFELVQKAAVAGIPVLAAVGAPSSLAVELAQDQGMTVLGFVRHDRFNVYSGSERLAASSGGSASGTSLPRRSRL